MEKSHFDAHAKRLEPYITASMKDSGDKAPSGKWDNARVGEDVGPSKSATKNLSNLWDVYLGSGDSKLVRGAAGAASWATRGAISTEAGLYNKLKDPFGRLLAKGALGFQISDQEGKAFADQLPDVIDSSDIAARKMAYLYSQLSDKAITTFEQASPADRERVRKSMADMAGFLLNAKGISEHKKARIIIENSLKELLGSE
jgi:hypothetical protein